VLNEYADKRDNVYSVLSVCVSLSVCAMLCYAVMRRRNGGVGGDIDPPLLGPGGYRGYNEKLTRATKWCCRQSLTISAINCSGRASELESIVNLVQGVQ